MSLLGLDVGTTACKVVAFDERGTVLAKASREYPLLNPQPGYYELDPNRVWADIRRCLQQVNAQLHADPVTALAISSQGEAVVPVAADGQVLANSPISSDVRCEPQVQQLREKLGDARIYELTGQPPSTMYTLPKIMWWREHNPALFESSWKFLCYSDFVTMRLGLPPVIDHSMAARTQAFDIRALDWCDELLAVAGIDRSRLAAHSPSGTVIGSIPARLAQDLGFRGTVQVVAGGHDQPCAALGAGVLQSGKAMYSIGTTEALAALIPQPRADLQQHNLAYYPHVVPKTLLVLTGNQTGGRLLRWYRDELAAAERVAANQAQRDVYDVIVEQVDEQPSRLLLLPYFAGSGVLHNDPLASGALIGLNFGTRRKEIVKAILEGVTYEQALNLRYLRDIGVEIDGLRAVGGGARSDIWLQLKADITSLPIQTIHTSEAASLALALLAGWATGIYDDLVGAAQALIRVSKTFYPRAEAARHYQAQLAVYADLYAALRPIYAALAAH